MQSLKSSFCGTGKAVAVKLDVTSLENYKDVVRTAVKEFGEINIAFFNAGVPILQPNTPLWECDEKTWDMTMSVNLKGVFLGVKAIIPQMIKQGKGISLLIGPLLFTLDVYANRRMHRHQLFSKRNSAWSLRVCIHRSKHICS